jgi:sigma-B regulation protein RsbU (phosphoserine phosphatase)
MVDLSVLTEEAMVLSHDPVRKSRGSTSPEEPFSFFTGVDAATVELVCQHLREEVLPAGHIVFEDNAPGDHLYIVKSGRLKISRTLDNGQEHVLAQLEPGEMFGEMALLEDKPRSARVTTCTPSRLLAMSRQTFDTLIERHPTVIVYLLKIISARLRTRNHEQEELLEERRCLVEELAAKNAELEQALVELQAAMATVKEHERVKRDLEIARLIQRQMLPAVFPQLPALQMHASMVPSHWVGGDFYDAVCLDSQRVALLLGDVSGKGIPAAMQMARLMGEFRACVSHRADPGGVLQLLNELLCARNVEWTSFVTVQYLLLDLAERRVQFICAGHPPVFLCHTDGQVERLGSVVNYPLGIDPTFAYHHEECMLTPGDRLLLYSDGAYELQDASGEMLGLPRLETLFATAPGHPEATIHTLQDALMAFHQADSLHDDTTFVCVRVG